MSIILNRYEEIVCEKIILNYIIHQNINVPFHLWDFENSITNYSKYICMKYIFPIVYNVNLKKHQYFLICQ